MLDAESTAELAAVMQPTDPQLAEAFATTAIAPRVAVLCLLHEWAICAATRPVEGTAEAAPVTAAIPGATDAATAGVCPAADGRTSSPSAPAAGDATVPSTGAAHAARHMWAQLLKLAMEDPELGSNKYFAKGPTHRRKVGAGEALARGYPRTNKMQACCLRDDRGPRGWTGKYCMPLCCCSAHFGP